jgi:aryl-alcohol dehydrogenase-like predicted oxidoreductase
MAARIDKKIQTIRPTIFPKTIEQITRVGLGGEGALRTTGEQNAPKVIHEAVYQGITYFDSARVYMDSELYYGSYWKNHPGKRERVFHTSKSAQRTRKGALAELTQTLNRLNTSYLDLWQIHDVRDEKDLALISQKRDCRNRHEGIGRQTLYCKRVGNHSRFINPICPVP